MLIVADIYVFVASLKRKCRENDVKSQQLIPLLSYYCMMQQCHKFLSTLALQTNKDHVQLAFQHLCQDIFV